MIGKTVMVLSVTLAWGTLVRGSEADPIEVRLPYGDARAIDVADLVLRLARATDVPMFRPRGRLSVPVVGLGSSLSKSALAQLLEPDAHIAVAEGLFVVRVEGRVLDPAHNLQWRTRLRALADLVEQEEKRRASYGMHALGSYRPNDPGRPTVCLVHGLNSSSGGFVHFIPPLESAGFGVLVYDYPYNRALAESSKQFTQDWTAFRKRAADARPWAIVAHSMGALLARSYVEDPEVYRGDVSSLILIAPVNQGSSLAKGQTLLQMLRGVQSLRANRTSETLAQLGDGLGQAASDLLPESPFLRSLNTRPRAGVVRYHIVAGDAGLLNARTRAEVEERLEQARQQDGLLGGLTRLATGDLKTRLDEISDGTGDGCVSVANTRLPGVGDHVVIHANHAELIRAPLLFSDPGPVPSMPWVLHWLGNGNPRPPAPNTGTR